LVILLLLSAALLVRNAFPLGKADSYVMPPPRDLAAYWGSSALLLHRQDPYDRGKLLELQRTLGWTGEEPVPAWNPPIIHVLLLPLGALPFQTATLLWYIANPVLITLAALVVWSSLSPAPSSRLPVHIPILVWSFAPSLHTVLEGQVTTFVLIGLAGYLLFRSQERDFLAGASCALMLVKPHLVYLVLPLLLVDAAREKRWPTLAGLAVALLIPLTLATHLYPAWPTSYLRLLQSQFSPAVHGYLTPTVSSLLAVCLHTDLGRYLWLPILPLAMYLYWRHGQRVGDRALLSWGLFGSLLTTPFGWASDQVVLLGPLVEVVARAMGLSPSRRWMVFGAMGLVFLFAWWFWVGNYQELPNLAVVPAIGSLYAYSSLDRSRS
jgi:hypothetical protein